jgi:hypothetical protein
MPSQAIQDATCEICPAQLLRFGRFDVSDKPGRDTQYDRTAGWRTNAVTGVPTCVHPYRVGLPAALYASAGVTLPDIEMAPPMPDATALDLPDEPTLLEAWFVAVLRTTAPHAMASALGAAETTALTRFDSSTVVAAIRRVMSTELTRR